MDILNGSNKTNMSLPDMSTKISSEFKENYSSLSILDNLETILKSSDSRIDWNYYFMGLALWAKHRSACHKLKVGCVIVKENRIICMGYNGFLPNSPHTSRIRDNHEISTVHAEQNAISDAAARGVSIKNSTIYISHFPCINCFKIIAASCIKNIFYHYDYKNDEIVTEMALENGIKIVRL